MRLSRHPGSVLTILALGMVHPVHADAPKALSQTAVVRILYVFHDRPGLAQVMATGDGTIYGTIAWGGPNAAGVVYRVSPGGTARILHTFSGPDGIYPAAAPIEGSDGAIYGAAQFGSTLSAHCGIYRITDSGAFDVVYLLPNPVAGETFAARIRGRSAERVYTIEGGAGGANCKNFIPETQSAQNAGPEFSIVSEHKAFGCCDQQQAVREWMATQERLGEEITQLVDPGHGLHRNSCSPDRPAPAVTGYRIGAVSCQVAGHMQCYIYQLEKSNAVSIAYHFDVPLQYCRFPAPLVSGDDGNLYGTITGYSTPYLALFRVNVGNPSGPSTVHHN